MVVIRKVTGWCNLFDVLKTFNNKYDSNSAKRFIFLIIFKIINRELKKVLKYFEKFL